MNNLFDIFNISNQEQYWYITKIILALIFVVYIVIYSGLQVRQVGILQQKVSTNVDATVRLFTYIYLLIIVIASIFVLSLVIL